MKTLTAIAIICLTSRAYIPAVSADLGDDVRDILRLIPLERVQSILEDYMVNYDETRHIFTYLRGEKVDALIKEIDQSDEVQKIFTYFFIHGYKEIYDRINGVHDFLGWPYVENPWAEKKVRNLEEEAKGTWDEMVQKILSYLPLDEIKEVINYKLQSSDNFSGLYARLSADDFRSFAERIYNEASTQEVISDLESMNVNVDQIVQAAKDFLGWN